MNNSKIPDSSSKIQVQKFRVSLSIQEMDSILSALSSQVDKILENAALIGWIQKQKLKAEVGLTNPSYSTIGARSISLSQSTKIVNQSEEAMQKQCFEAYTTPGIADLSEDGIIAALRYKYANPIQCGSLTQEESEVLNDWLSKNI